MMPEPEQLQLSISVTTDVINKFNFVNNVN